jgi:uncharacterized membrane protein YphA (DoxX/SURF4 family)
METIAANHRMHSVYNIMRITYAVVPIVAGLDKFTNLLTNWEQYLNPDMAAMLPFSAHTFMMIVGVIEIAAGLLVLAKPAIGGYVVMAWLALIAFTLLLSREYLDVAVRDLVMAIGAYSFVQIAKAVTAPKTEQHSAPGEIAYQ